MVTDDYRGQWDASILNYVLSRLTTRSQSSIYEESQLFCTFTPISSPGANQMIELRTFCRRKVMVHKALLCHYSSYYDAAINGPFQESKSEYFELKLSKGCAEVFMRWLYSGEVGDRINGPLICELIDLYIFADRVDILALRRKVMTEMVLKTGTHTRIINSISYDRLVLIASSLPPSAPLYRYAVEWYANHFPHEAVDIQNESGFEEMSKEFLHLVICKLASRTRLTDGDEKLPCKCCHGPCHYHEHESKKEWSATCRQFHDLKLVDCPDGLEEYPQPKESSTCSHELS